MTQRQTNTLIKRSAEGNILFRPKTLYNSMTKPFCTNMCFVRKMRRFLKNKNPEGMDEERHMQTREEERHKDVMM